MAACVFDGMQAAHFIGEKMSAKLINFLEEKQKVETRPAEFEELVSDLKHYYPVLLNTEAVMAVEQWHQERDDEDKRLWVDNDINCVINIPHWQEIADSNKLKRFPAGIVYRAAVISNRDLPISFPLFNDDQEDEDYREIWHTTRSKLIETELFLDNGFVNEIEDDEEDIDCILNARHLFASERMTSMHAAHNELEEIHKKEAIQRRLKEKFKSKAKSNKALNSLTDEELEILG